MGPAASARHGSTRPVASARHGRKRLGASARHRSKRPSVSARHESQNRWHGSTRLGASVRRGNTRCKNTAPPTAPPHEAQREAVSMGRESKACASCPQDMDRTSARHGGQRPGASARRGNRQPHASARHRNKRPSATTKHKSTRPGAGARRDSTRYVSTALTAGARQKTRDGKARHARARRARSGRAGGAQRRTAFLSVVTARLPGATTPKPAASPRHRRRPAAFLGAATARPPGAARRHAPRARHWPLSTRPSSTTKQNQTRTQKQSQLARPVRRHELRHARHAPPSRCPSPRTPTCTGTALPRSRYKYPDVTPAPRCGRRHVHATC